MWQVDLERVSPSARCASAASAAASSMEHPSSPGHAHHHTSPYHNHAHHHRLLYQHAPAQQHASPSSMSSLRRIRYNQQQQHAQHQQHHVLVHHHQQQTPPPPHMHFPPPPNYPPTMAAHSSAAGISGSAHGGGGMMLENDHLAIAGPSNIDYSYAYYEPGPATRHTNLPGGGRYEDHRGRSGSGRQQQQGCGSGAYREGSYRSKHTYLTRYGTEENIYEEISDVARARLLQGGPPSGTIATDQRHLHHQQSLLSLNQSLVEEEVRRVQTGHKRVLDQLNLSVEAMLMPSSSSNGDGSNSRSSGSDNELLEDDKVTDLLTVGPTDELLSPVVAVVHHHHQDLDSGFSGSSSGASYRSAGGSLRRGGVGSGSSAASSMQRPRSAAVLAASNSAAITPCKDVITTVSASDSSASSGHGGHKGHGSASTTPSKSFWSRKAWRRLGFSSTSLNKHHKDEPRIRSGVWEDVVATIPPGATTTTANTTLTAGTTTPPGGAGSRRSSASAIHGHHQHHHHHHHPQTGGSSRGNNKSLVHSSSSQRSSEESWCSGSDPDAVSSDDDDEDEEEEDETDRSATSSSARSHQLRNPFHKAKSLWRGSTPSATTTTLSPAAAATAATAATTSTTTAAAAPGHVQMRHSLDGGLQPADLAALASAAAAASPSNSGAAGGGGGTTTQGRLSRWFSMRRGSAHQYDVDSAAAAAAAAAPPAPAADGSPSKSVTGGGGGSKMPLLSEVEEETFPSCTMQQRRQVPPSLPPPPADLTQPQQKRRMIIAAIVHSENSYVATLQRLVNDYKKPLEESSPPILSNTKIGTLFYRLPEILQCHTLFRIALAESVHNWDREERIGDVFVASFSKAIVLDIYSGFINNFSVAMDLAKMEAKRKSALADFLKVKQISSHDRLSFFGLMVKPVQRFPQFILFLQDLLKHTPQGHHDRMSLQLALTQLESLAEMLNERKREAEQFQAFKETLRHISGKFTARPLSDSNRYLLREDDVTQLDFNQYGLITKAKSRRLLLLNDLVVCVAVAAKQSDDFNNASKPRLTLKWMHPVADVEIQDTSASPTLSRLLTQGSNNNRSGSLKSNASFDASTSAQPQADNLCTEMSNLMYDYEVLSRIQDLIGSLRATYAPFSLDTTRTLLHQIQSSIQHKDAEMLWLDSCCLQLVVRTKGGTKEEVFTFQTDTPTVKKEWVTELRLAQLALDPCNSPAWEVPEQENRPSTKMPLFVRAQAVYRSQHQTEVRCGCYYTITSSSSKSSKQQQQQQRPRAQSYLWVCTSDGASSHIAILAQHQQHAGSLKDISSFSLVETQITCMEFVKGATPPCPSLASDLVFFGTTTRKMLIYAADSLDSEELVSACQVPDCVVQIKYLCDTVFVALANGSLLIFRRTADDNSWVLQEYDTLQLGSEPVSCLLPINTNLYAACAKKVFVINALTCEIAKSFSVQHEHIGNVNLMAHSGIGLWISLKNSSTICLYHTETFKHLQDINVASNVMRVTTSTGSSNDSLNNNRSQVNVTALLACKGLLWVGTNVGISLTIPLPRLEGVPIISGRVNISYHAHFGPISFLLALQPKSYYYLPPKPEPVEPIIEQKPKLEHQVSESAAKLRHHLANSPLVIRRRKSKENDISRLSKTLPRGLGSGNKSFSTSTTSSQGSGDTCDVYGLYGKLMYIKDFEHTENCLQDHPVYESLRRSDPELAAIPGKVSTLDRRLKMKVSRPRSLDLSNWSVDSRSSSVYTSSGSEESLALRLSGKSVSRNNSNVSRLTSNEHNFIATTATIKENEATTAKSKTLGKGNAAAVNSGDGNGSRRTIITLMGGRGYVNWRQPCCNPDKGNGRHVATSREANTNDSHIVIWELKL